MKFRREKWPPGFILAAVMGLSFNGAWMTRKLYTVFDESLTLCTCALIWVLLRHWYTPRTKVNAV